MNIVEKNALLDVFMESKGRSIPVFDQYGHELSSDYVPNSYHSDWNLLMKVIESIEDLGYSVIIEGWVTFIDYDEEKSFKKITSISENSKRESVYNAIVSFISTTIKH